MINTLQELMTAYEGLPRRSKVTPAMALYHLANSRRIRSRAAYDWIQTGGWTTTLDVFVFTMGPQHLLHPFVTVVASDRTKKAGLQSACEFLLIGRNDVYFPRFVHMEGGPSANPANANTIGTTASILPLTPVPGSLAHLWGTGHLNDDQEIELLYQVLSSAPLLDADAEEPPPPPTRPVPSTAQSSLSAPFALAYLLGLAAEFDPDDVFSSGSITPPQPMLRRSDSVFVNAHDEALVRELQGAQGRRAETGALPRRSLDAATLAPRVPPGWHIGIDGLPEPQPDIDGDVHPYDQSALYRLRSNHSQSPPGLGHVVHLRTSQHKSVGTQTEFSHPCVICYQDEATHGFFHCGPASSPGASGAFHVTHCEACHPRLLGAIRCPVCNVRSGRPVRMYFA